MKTAKYFQRTNDGKLLLRKMMSRILPQEVVEAEKQGLTITPLVVANHATLQSFRNNFDVDSGSPSIRDRCGHFQRRQSQPGIATHPLGEGRHGVVGDLRLAPEAPHGVLVRPPNQVGDFFL